MQLLLIWTCLVAIGIKETAGVGFDLTREIQADDLIYWKGTTSTKNAPAQLIITAKRQGMANGQTWLKMQVQGGRNRIYVTMTSAKRCPPNCYCNMGKLLGRGKNFEFLIRLRPDLVMIYMMEDSMWKLKYTVDIPAYSPRITALQGVRIYGSARTEIIKLLEDDDLARSMRLPNCGKNRDDSVDIPSMCEDKGRKRRQIEEEREEEIVVEEETDVIDESELETDEEYLNIEDDGINVGPPVNTRTGDARRIIGGRSAHPGKSPWQVAIRKKKKFANGYPHQCGGILINSCWVVTAAHCFPTTSSNSLRQREIRVGDYYNDDTNEGLTRAQIDELEDKEKQRDRDILAVYKHERYISYPSPKQDIALIRLKQCVNFEKYVQPACLPLQTDDPEGEDCLITGWGATNFTQWLDEHPHCLQQATLAALSPKQCLDGLSGYGNIFNPDTMLCAKGDKNEDTCQGDSGGPLVCTGINNKATLFGITSFGIGCGGPTPGVYTKVASYIRWMFLIMNLEPNDSSLRSKLRSGAISSGNCKA